MDFGIAGGAVLSALRMAVVFLLGALAFGFPFTFRRLIGILAF